MSNYKILAIVVTFNGSKWIQKSLSSINSSTISVDIVVIDNGSVDGTIELIENQFPEVKLIRSQTNLFFGRGNNIGLRIAIEENYDFAFLLNQDAFIGPDTIAHLVDVQLKNKAFGILSPFHLNWDGTKVDHYFLQMVNPFDCPNFLSDRLLTKEKEIYELKFIHAACWLISRSCLEKVGGFDPIFKHYGEDNDYVTRVRLKGFKIGICPKTYLFHYGCFDVSVARASNYYLDQINTLVELKTISNSLTGNYIYFLKKKLDDALTMALQRNFKGVFRNLKLSLYSLSKLHDIIKARSETYKNRAFLSEQD